MPACWSAGSGRRRTDAGRRNIRAGYPCGGARDLSGRDQIDPRKIAALLVVAALLAVSGAVAWRSLAGREVPSFRSQACGLPPQFLERTQRGFFEPRSGQIAILPRQPAYMASGGGGWSHSGPWPYLQDVPLVFYGPGILDEGVTVDRPVTLADVAPTTAALLHGAITTDDGDVLSEVADLDAETLEAPRPKLVLTIVWDGGGWNTLEQWPGDWANLLEMMDGGVTFTNATVGSSPSVTPAVHTTLGTGVFPWTHGVTGVPVRDEEGRVVDSFLDGASSRFVQAPTLAERWDEQNDNAALVGMLGYEPWHLGMIGKGAESPAGDRDDAVWLEPETNEWKTNPEHYVLPEAVTSTSGLAGYIDELDAADGEVDGAWLDNEILDMPGRWEETPAFIKFHRDALFNMIRDGGYGDDEVTDLLYTNFKQIDRVGHYFNMESEEVNAALLETDDVLGETLEFLDAEVGRGNYVVILTADHGQQPDAADVGGYGIAPRELRSDIDREFGKVTRAVWPTEIFLDEEAMEQRGVTVEEIAGFVAAYELGDNAPGGRYTGSFEAGDRLFDMAIPARLLTTIDCGTPASR